MVEDVGRQVEECPGDDVEQGVRRQQACVVDEAGPGELLGGGHHSVQGARQPAALRLRGGGPAGEDAQETLADRRHDGPGACAQGTSAVKAGDGEKEWTFRRGRRILDRNGRRKRDQAEEAAGRTGGAAAPAAHRVAATGQATVGEAARW